MGFLLYAAALLGGAAANVATGMNTALGRAFADHRVLSALTIYGSGFLAILAIALAAGAFAPRPPPEALAGLPWWAWAGGAVRAVTGGTVTALLLDHRGLLGFAQRDATPPRLGGCALLVAGTAAGGARAGRRATPGGRLSGRVRSPPLRAPR